MTINIVEDNLNLSISEREFILNKLVPHVNKVTKNFADDILNAFVKVSRPNTYEYSVNFDLMLPGNKHVYAQQTADTLKNAVNSLKDEIFRQIKRVQDAYRR